VEDSDYQSLTCYAGILLDANENAYGPSLSAIESNGSTSSNGIHAATDEDDYAALQLNRYPDPVQGEIKQKFADFRSFKYGQKGTFLGVGSDEIIDLLIRITCVPGQGTGDAILGGLTRWTRPSMTRLLSKISQFARQRTACTLYVQQSTM
jgi:histidinol-phosphate/aromatic aminotransferase/cobyric acid decarboxylase-like protein